MTFIHDYFFKPFFSLTAILNYDKMEELCHSFQVFDLINFESCTFMNISIKQVEFKIK